MASSPPRAVHSVCTAVNNNLIVNIRFHHRATGASLCNMQLRWAGGRTGGRAHTQIGGDFSRMKFQPLDRSCERRYRVRVASRLWRWGRSEARERERPKCRPYKYIDNSLRDFGTVCGFGYCHYRCSTLWRRYGTAASTFNSPHPYTHRTAAQHIHS